MFQWLRRLFPVRKSLVVGFDTWWDVGVLVDKIRALRVRAKGGEVLAASEGATVGKDGTWIHMTAIASGAAHDVEFQDDCGRPIVVVPWKSLTLLGESYICTADTVRLSDLTFENLVQKQPVPPNLLRLNGVVVEQPVKPKRKRARRKKAKPKPKRKACAKPKAKRRKAKRR